MLKRTTLSREHAELDQLAERLLMCLAAKDGPPVELGAIRWRLNRVLMLHLAKEDRILYPALQRSNDPMTRAIAASFAAEMGGLSQACLDYMTRWTTQAVHHDWPGFRTETQAVIAALRWRIQREEIELYPRMTDAAAA